MILDVSWMCCVESVSAVWWFCMYIQNKHNMAGDVSSPAHRVQMCALVLCSVAGVAEGLEAARVLADVGFLSGVASQVDLQVLQAGERFGAALKLRKKNIKEHWINT